MIFDKKVEEVLKNAETEAKGSPYGTPHVMLALTETKDFASAYPGDYDKLKSYLKYCKTTYKESGISSSDNRGKDLVITLDVIIPSVYDMTKELKTKDTIILAHLFLALCAKSRCLDLPTYFDSIAIDKMEIFKNLATYCDVSDDDVDFTKINNCLYEMDLSAGKVKAFKMKRRDPELDGGPDSDSDSDSASESTGTDTKISKLPPALRKFCTDLVEESKDYDKPFIGRADVIERTLQVLCKKEKSNPVHVGEPGVGKSAVTKGLAKMIADEKVPDILKGSQLFELDLTALVAGTCYRGDFEKRIKAVLDTLEKMDKPILFIDEIHMLISAGAGSSGAMDAANILKPYLTKGKIKFIGATTYKEFAQYIEKDPALMRRFQKIEIKEPSIADSIKIIDGLKEAYEKYHGVTYTEEAIQKSVELTARHIHDRFLPDKAIDVLDEAGAYVNVHPEHDKIIDKDVIDEILSSVCSIPKSNLTDDALTTVLNIEDTLNSKVFGQEKAVHKVSEAIQLNKSGLGDENKPIGSFLFVGPSGVGKTELARQIADSLSMKLLRFDMSEYSEPHSVSKLIGTASGYVGYEEGGLLTNAILKDPNCVILLDEIEKAHPEIFKTFLQMMDYGMLTDNKGRKVDCRNAIIIYTSNAGVANAAKPSLGFISTKEEVNTDAITDAVNTLFSVEFRNRLTGIVTFNGLSEDMSILIAKKELNILDEKLKKKGYKVDFTENCVKKLAKDGTSYEFGARNMQRLIDEVVKRPFVEKILAHEAEKNFKVDVADDKIEIIPVYELEEA